MDAQERSLHSVEGLFYTKLGALQNLRCLSSLSSSDHRVLDKLGVTQSQLGDYSADAKIFARIVAAKNHAPIAIASRPSLVANSAIEPRTTDA